MLRISGSFSAENCVKASETKLQEFGITTEKHIVACVTDGANLVENTVEVEDKSHEEEDNGESEELAEDLDKVLDLEFESSVGIDALFHVTYAEKNSTTNINETIKKIRNVAKLFRKSPIKNDILQKYVMATKKSLAVKRWTSPNDRTRLFCEEEESISNFSHSEEEIIEILKENPLALDEKLEKAIYSKTSFILFNQKYQFQQNHETRDAVVRLD
ncbi:hypothetical protein TNCV_319171 [Trichonephila clavipes]|nr:hypothetical protein TNCV_319171 [Trichonephila clavipes]